LSLNVVYRSITFRLGGPAFDSMAHASDRLLSLERLTRRTSRADDPDMIYIYHY
jgi:hypothetical protein